MTTPESDPCREEPTDTCEAEANGRFQFRLYHLFWVTFLVAVIAVVAKSFGPGTLPLSIGLALACLNAQGFFGFLQRKGTRPRVCYVAWLLVAVSMLLPSAKGCNNEQIQGWKMAQIVFVGEGNMLHEAATSQKPLGVGDCMLIIRLTLINLANLLIVISPLMLSRLQQGQGRLMGNALAISAVSVWLISWENGGGYLVGYYVWAGAIALLLVTIRIRWRMFAAMVILGLVIVAIGSTL